MTVSIRETVNFYLDKGMLHYAPSVALRDLRHLLAERDALYDALEATLTAATTDLTVSLTPGDPDPPAAEDYPSHTYYRIDGVDTEDKRRIVDDLGRSGLLGPVAPRYEPDPMPGSGRFHFVADNDPPYGIGSIWTPLLGIALLTLAVLLFFGIRP